MTSGNSNPEPIVVEPMSIVVNLSPAGFQHWARQYFEQAELAMASTRAAAAGFNPVPYLLLGHSIELALKSHHLEGKTQEQVKTLLNHNLSKAYALLSNGQQTLDSRETALLQRISNVHAGMYARYMRMEDALTAFRSFPDLDATRDLAKKLVDALPPER